MKNFSDRLRYYMVQKGLKQADLVERSGINKSSISEYLSGNYEPKQRNIYKIALALGVKPSQLMGVAEEDRGTILSKEELELLKKYRQLSASGKKAVYTHLKFVLQEEANGSEQEEENLG